MALSTLTPLDQNHKRCLALFDFDGTITDKDSMLAFVRYVVGSCRYMSGMFCLTPIFLAYKIGLIDAKQAKQNLLYWFLSKYETRELCEYSSTFCATRLPNIIRFDALSRLNEHRKIGHKVVVVSASAELWLKPWCERNGVELIATKLDMLKQPFAGQLLGENCKGSEKVVRINSEFNVQQFDKIYAYGDSRGDNEMLSIADFPHYRVFKK